MQKESRNTVLFFAIAMLLLIGYQFFILGPQAKERAAEAKAKAAIAEKSKKAAVGANPARPVVPAGTLSRNAAIAASQRVPIATRDDQGSRVVPVLTGSINLTGARLDDLFLQQYGQTVDKDSPRVDLLRPEQSPNAFFAEFLWKADNVAGLPDERTVWAVKQGSRLTETTPVVLTYTSPQGLVFDRTIAVDRHYMFTITDTVTNTGAAPVSLRPAALVRRAGLPPEAGKGQNVHEGGVGVMDGELRLQKYPDWKKKGQKGQYGSWEGQGGWLGITDKYWLAAVVPAQSATFTGNYRYDNLAGRDYYTAGSLGAVRTIAPGATITESTRLFAGAKKAQLLKGYEKGEGGAQPIPAFDKAVDWGVLNFLTRPFFMALEFFYGFVGNFGVAILLVTLCVRIILFPLANKSYESMSKMKKLTEPMKELKEKYKDDPAKMQQETMALYQREKVNPLVGCLPLLLQIPVFLAFYKVLSVTIEMRHAPFFGFIKDLSARDPTNIWNLFGLLPYDPGALPLVGGILSTHPASTGVFMAGALGLGVCVLFYGFTMWLTTAMNPPAPDPMQQRIFQLMPILFTFIMAPFAVGLIVYWTFSNVLSIIQQYIIMHRLKVDNPIDDFLNRFRAKAV
ncbi:membrane protein insertase YidC [Caulobacter sp. SLTY]|uniref:membrane protein insertase YidC n=1 Tax=Caulobacter sp. SLTY TaxID=2683262 RepID=UPI0014137076|nr:membrane protein insertase YidC [Caulobacter sp. SLTY]NBB14193.1 membrane protein insertase YidC [Caulobacter sp. SLTY]